MFYYGNITYILTFTILYMLYLLKYSSGGNFAKKWRIIFFTSKMKKN